MFSDIAFGCASCQHSLHTSTMTTDTFGVSTAQDVLLTLQTFVISPVGFINGIVICYLIFKILRRQYQKQNVYYRSAAISTVISVCSALPNFFVITVVSNDSIFPITFNNQTFTNFITIMLMGTFIIGKITYYMAFSFHAQSILFENKHKSPSKFLNLWTCIISLFVIGCGFWTTYDVTTHPDQVAVGVSKTGMSYLVPSSSSNKGSDIAALWILAVDVIYYVVLTRFYIKTVRSMVIRSDSTMKAKGIKGLVLITMSSCVFYMTLIVGAVDVFTYIAIQGIDFISDAICLALTFEEHERAYQWLCGSFDSCCIRCIFGGGGAFEEYENPQALLSVKAKSVSEAPAGDMEHEDLIRVNE